LQSLSRFRTARYAISELHARIIDAQGSLDSVFGEEPLPPFAPYTPPVPAATRPNLQPHDPRLMRVVFYLSFAAAGLSVVRCFYEPEWVTNLTLWVTFAFAALCPVAIIRSYNTTCPPVARRLTCIVLAFNALAVPIALLLMGLLFLAGVDIDRIDTLSNMSPVDGGGFFLLAGLELSTILLHVACAVRGLAALRIGQH